MLKGLKKAVGNKYAFELGDDENPYNVNEYVDTGCYSLNAALSDGNIFAGIPVGKRVILGGPSGTAKSFLLMYSVKAYLEKYPEATVMLFESEGSDLGKMAEDLGVPKDNIVIFPVVSVEDFKIQIVNALDYLEEEQEKARKAKSDIPRAFILLDSLGMLPSEKEFDDAKKGEVKVDFTRAKQIRSVFRLITLKLSLTQTPFFCTNHTYADIGAFITKQKQGGGGGAEYAPDVSLILSRAQEKEGSEKVGVIITLTVEKSRYMQMGKKFKILLLFSKGLFKFSDMIDKAIEYGVWGAGPRKTEVEIDGEVLKKKVVTKDPEKYFTDEVLSAINSGMVKDCSFGAVDEEEVEIDEEDES